MAKEQSESMSKVTVVLNANDKNYHGLHDLVQLLL